MKRIHIVGRKNSGKTTLIVELVTELTRQGYRVGTIKHTSHKHEIDTPGKDSFRHKEAGSKAVGILSKGVSAIFWPTAESDPGDRYVQFDAIMKDCDLVLVEGDSKADAPKVEVVRVENESAPIATHDSTIQAIISDDSLELGPPVWKRRDVSVIAANILGLLNVS